MARQRSGAEAKEISLVVVHRVAQILHRRDRQRADGIVRNTGISGTDFGAAGFDARGHQLGVENGFAPVLGGKTTGGPIFERVDTVQPAAQFIKFAQTVRTRIGRNTVDQAHNPELFPKCAKAKGATDRVGYEFIKVEQRSNLFGIDDDPGIGRQRRCARRAVALVEHA